MIFSSRGTDVCESSTNTYILFLTNQILYVSVLLKSILIMLLKNIVLSICFFKKIASSSLLTVTNACCLYFLLLTIDIFIISAKVDSSKYNWYLNLLFGNLLGRLLMYRVFLIWDQNMNGNCFQYCRKID